jgi:hypothetical protein
MLKIKNASGDVTMIINDNGDEEFKDKQVEEEYKQANKRMKEKTEKDGDK